MISIAMCTYNGERYLQAQLDSIALQSRLPDELIICDDQSQDNTVKIIESFANKIIFPIRLFINEKNLGSTKNFEKAIQLCQGDIIAFSDQDDIWYPKKIECIETAFTKNPNAGLIFSNAEMVNENLYPLGYSLWESLKFNHYYQNQFKLGDAISTLLYRNVVTGAVMAFRSYFKDLILPIPDIWMHDAWVALLIAAMARIVPINQELIKYRQHRVQQIGAIKKTFKNELSGALKHGSDIYMNRAHQCKLAYERLLEFNKNYLQKKIISQFESCIEHNFKRSMIPKQKLYRLIPIFKEVLTFRYQKYSSGFKSIASDLFFH